MPRIINYSTEQLQTEQRISSFLKSKGYSERNLVNLRKDPESICLNGEYVYMNNKIKAGDELRVCIREQESSEQINPVELPISIAYEDEDLMVINKPAGMPIHPSLNNHDNTLGNALAWLYRERGETFVYRCINRLDRDTSGLTIIAKHMLSASILGHMVQQKGNAGGIHREYLAIVDGRLKDKEGTISAPIARKESSCLERIVDFNDGDKAVTHYRVVEEYPDASLVLLVLETGRTHQIRVHMKYLGHPLLGDFLYHPAYAANQIDRVEESITTSDYDMKRQALHASRLRFTHPITGETLDFTVPLPEDMSSWLVEKEDIQ